MPTYFIHVAGQVQGVGFRPFIVRLGHQLGLAGSVCNTTNGVHIRVNCHQTTDIEKFVAQIREHHPQGARINGIYHNEIPEEQFDGFTISTSSDREERSTYISPDYGICHQCKQELQDTSNRRYRYPFITCTDCGPRLSVINDIPYDRANTEMTIFKMCVDCASEYTTPKDRRFHSQTNSCGDCGVSLYSLTSPVQNQEELIGNTVSSLHAGDIVAVKGTGGFLLMCDATNRESLLKLRKRKNRPFKPFALLYPDMEMLESDVCLSLEEKSAISSIVFPIVLVNRKTNAATGIVADVIAPDNNLLGVMLPNNPLLSILAKDFGKPLIATSANISGSPILYTDEQMDINLSDIVDYVLSHNRGISQPQDDSVWRFTPFYNKRIIIRRSRGMAPAFWQKNEEKFPHILAAGADLKSSFGIAKDSQIYLSQFSGDLTGYENQLQYRHILDRYIKYSGLKPEIIVTDIHPGYNSSQLVSHIEAAQSIKVQHHKAHFAACLYEHDLLDNDEKLLGVVWDGVGYGEDGQIWGGEFFTFSGNKMQRVAHLDIVPYLLGDKMSLQPRLSALVYCELYGIESKLVRQKFSEREYNLYLKMLHQYKGVITSSAGRLFDAVACILGCGDYNSYEGETAMKLEQLAMQYCTCQARLNEPEPYPFYQVGNKVRMESIMKSIVHDVNIGIGKSEIAARFHKTMTEVIRMVAVQQNCRKLFFSGGVFQNALLVDMIVQYLSSDYELHFHEEVPPNDENIALGQIVMASKMIK